MKSNTNDTKQSLRALGIAVSFPFIFASGPIVGYLIGEHFLVRRLNTPAFVVFVCVALGFLGSIYQVIALVKKINAIEVEESQKDL